MDERVILQFEGQLQRASMEGFARHRAARLDLSLEVLTSDSGCLRLALTGQPDLIDAFEMALSLGPRDCLVLEVRRETNMSTERNEG